MMKVKSQIQIPPEVLQHVRQAITGMQACLESLIAFERAMASHSGKSVFLPILTIEALLEVQDQGELSDESLISTVAEHMEEW